MNNVSRISSRTNTELYKNKVLLAITRKFLRTLRFLFVKPWMTDLSVRQEPVISAGSTIAPSMLEMCVYLSLRSRRRLPSVKYFGFLLSLFRTWRHRTSLHHTGTDGASV